MRQAGEFLRKAAGYVRHLGVEPRGDGDNEISVRFPNGSRIVGLPSNEEHHPRLAWLPRLPFGWDLDPKARVDRGE